MLTAQTQSYIIFICLTFYIFKFKQSVNKALLTHAPCNNENFKTNANISKLYIIKLDLRVTYGLDTVLYCPYMV